MPLSNNITDFLEHLEVEKNASQLTIRNYDHYLKRFIAFAGDIEVFSIDDELVRKYRVFLARYKDPVTGRQLKNVTQNYFIIALRAFLRFLAKKDVQTFAAEKIELGKQDPRPIKYLEVEQLQRLLGAPDISTPDGLRDKAILETLFSTGLRVSELQRLNRDKINLSRREFGIVGKGGKERVVFISDSAADWIEKYLRLRPDRYNPLFVRYSGAEIPDNNGEKMRLSVRGIERIVDKYVKKAQLVIKASPHTLRHSFATDLIFNGADIRSVQEMLGHANVSTTQIYTHITNRQLRDVHKAFHSGNKEDI